jgi:fimbrial isopeptide formation D2 family protein/LPXTG-motif cell wall-anchored protein
MKKFKRIMALVIAMAMVLGLMSMAVIADTAGDLTPDSPITIEGLDSGDTVHLYQVLQWDENVGWVLVHEADAASPLAALTTTGDPNFSENVKKLIDNVPNTTLDKADLEKIANVVKTSGTDLANTEIASDTFTYDTSGAPGMYIALVTPGTAGVIYNPIVVSSDFSDTPNTSEIDASTAKMGTTSVAKKETISVTKNSEEADQADNQTTDGQTDGTNNAHDVGDIVKFTVTTKIPAYSNSYVNPSFKVSDELSNGLKMVVDDTNYPFTVQAGDMSYTINTDYVAGATSVAPKTDDTSFFIDFKKTDATEGGDYTPSKVDSVSELLDYQDVTITYWAKITGDCATNVTEEENTVTVEFSNNPKEDTGKGTIKDKTKHYTFTIDGSLLGEESWKNSELVKVGVDQQGNPIESVITESNGSRMAALEGAIFKLYQTAEAAENEDDTLLYKNYVFDGEVTSDAQGLMTIEGLDIGDYYLKEITAPKGYIASTKVWHINVAATITDTPTTEIIDGREVTYSVPILEDYTITIDDATTSKFEATITGSEVLSSTSKGDVSTSVPNTKGVELPSTGGIGTTIFYVVGAILVIGAGVVLITRRRMEAN